MVRSILKQFSLLAFLLLVFTSCGLPTQIVLDKPVVTSTGYDYDVSFETLSSPFVNGYVLYYKVYAQGADLELKNSDSKEIEENISLTGETLLNNLGFYPMYRYLEDEFVVRDLLEEYSSNGVNIVLDFADQSSFRILANSVIISDEKGELIPGRVQDKPEGPDQGKKSFTDNYLSTDDDLEQLYARLDGEPLTIAEIGIAVYAIGFDPSINTPISSLPVFLGTVQYNSPETN